mmetsp:Transcript_23920/g.94112  ORF Transcript_23920/g.94112 Transcript_23920/m.94112 type:complete len:569 (-) Transcript_23920:403-2109(-)
MAKKVLQEMKGNAVDAAVAASLCQGVVAPHASGLGGGSVITYFMAGSEDAGSIDARETAPNLAGTESTGSAAVLEPTSIGIPGQLRGLYSLHLQKGVVDWYKLVQLSVPLANSSTVSSGLSKLLKEAESSILSSSTLREVFAKPKMEGENDFSEDDGYIFSGGDQAFQVLEEGDTFSNPALATTLERIMDEPLALYGSLAESLSQDIQAVGGFVTRADLAKYRPVHTQPIKAFYQGLQVLTSQLPAGGPLLAFALNLLEGFHLGKRGRNGDAFHLIAEGLKHTFGWRSVLGDPAFDESLNELVNQTMLSKEYAMQLRSTIHMDSLKNSTEYTYGRSGLKVVRDRGTSHVSVIDEEGNAASISSSLNYALGSRFMSESTGLIMNNALVGFSPTQLDAGHAVQDSSRNRIMPGKRALSSLCPTIVLRNSRPYIVTGGEGGPNGISAVLQVLIGILEFGLSAGQAVSEPRIHHQLFPNSLRMEAIDPDTCGIVKSYKRTDKLGTPPFWSDVCLALKAKGHNTTFTSSIGSVNTVVRVGSKALSSEQNNTETSQALLFATADARKIGGAAAY